VFNLSVKVVSTDRQRQTDREVWYLFKGFNLSVKVVSTDRQRQTDRDRQRERCGTCSKGSICLVWYLFIGFNLSVKVV